MSQLIVSHLTFSYSKSPVDVLTDVSFSLSRAWYGVVGPNGSGKTTLLRILAGELVVDAATMSRVPSDMVVRYCPQSVTELTLSIRDFAVSGDRPARRMMGQLALDPKDLDRWPSLSPGERKRWQIGGALAEMPDLLLLDEPTNHLDFTARQLLCARLEQYGGIGVLVSHDRQLLDSLAAAILKIETNGNVELFSGSYSEARERWVTEEKRRREEREKLQAERRKLKHRLDSARRSRDAAESAMSTARRMKGIRDTDARSSAAKGRVAAAEQKLGHDVQVLRHRLRSAEEDAARVRVEKEVGRSVFVLEDAAPMRNLISLQQSALEIGGRTLVRDVDVTIGRDSRIHLKGANGSGKTTLIEALLRASHLPPERVLHLPQELSRESVDRIREEMQEMPGPERGRLLQVVAALGVPPERILASPLPSPGEARKLALAMGLSRQAWLLMLDEPTNHLDLPSIERIEDALTKYSCALVIVSHDERFAASLTHGTWAIERQMLISA